MSDMETEKQPKKSVNIEAIRKKLPEVFKKVYQSATVTSSNVVERIPRIESYTKFAFFVSSLGIRYKIAGALIITLMLTIASLGVVTFSRQKHILEQEMKKQAEVLVRQLASVGKEGLLTKQELEIYSTIKDIQKNTGVVHAMIVDSKGKVFVHNLLTEKGKVLNGEKDQKALKAEGLLFQQSSYLGEPVMEAALPIVYKAKNIKIGTARIGISQKELQNAISKQKLAFFWISTGFVFIGLLIAFALSRVLTRPIYTLAVGIQMVAQGDLSKQVKVFYKDEIGKLTENFNQMVLSLREKLKMEKYLSYSTLSSIKKDKGNSEVRLGGERKYVTALFSDVRGFTSMSEKMTPEEVVGLLNIYLSLQGRVINHRGGAIDKFVGDEVMAIFEGKGMEINAVRAAIDIQRYCQALNWSRTKIGKKQMQVGIGLNSGEVVMGNMGSEEQMDYTVIGDNINLAARLCSAAGPGQVVISKSVFDSVGKEAKMKKMEPISVKGKEKPVDVYEVLDVSGVLRKHMRRVIGLEASYHLAGLPDDVNQCTVKNVGQGGCLLEVAVPIGIGSKLDLSFDSKMIQGLNDVSAVVRHAKKHDSKYYVGVHFENLPEKSKHSIIQWVHHVETEIMAQSKT